MRFERNKTYPNQFILFLCNLYKQDITRSPPNLFTPQQQYIFKETPIYPRSSVKRVVEPPQTMSQAVSRPGDNSQSFDPKVYRHQSSTCVIRQQTTNSTSSNSNQTSPERTLDSVGIGDLIVV